MSREARLAEAIDEAIVLVRDLIDDDDGDEVQRLARVLARALCRARDASYVLGRLRCG